MIFFLLLRATVEIFHYTMDNSIIILRAKQEPGDACIFLLEFMFNLQDIKAQRLNKNMH